MDERTLAEIEARMMDPEAWGDPDDAPPPRRRSERRQRTAVVSVRLSASELATVEEYAASRGLTASGALRTATLEAASTTAQVVYPPRWHQGQAAANANESSVAHAIESNFAAAH